MWHFSFQFIRFKKKKCQIFNRQMRFFYCRDMLEANSAIHWYESNTWKTFERQCKLPSKWSTCSKIIVWLVDTIHMNKCLRLLIETVHLYFVEEEKDRQKFNTIQKYVFYLSIYWINFRFYNNFFFKKKEHHVLNFMSIVFACF